MTQQQQEQGSASGTAIASCSAANGSVTKSLSAQIDEAMAKLLSVSSKFKDLTGQDKAVSTREETIAMMQHYLTRLNLTDAVRRLSVVHVAGTKGKGSTCAMTERILREAGYKTGLFTSPHLISPCERFRINGKPVAQDKFLHHFYAVWDGLEQTASQSGEYPPMAWFFRFLTLLALHLFIAEDVDVVVLEVGIGGRLDATNVIEQPVVCGITTLDLDHVRVLGDTIDKIAYAKAGIFKRGVPAFTTAQEPLAMDMLFQCARETENPLLPAPTLDAMGPDGATCPLGMRGDYQRVNAGLAVALATTWLRHKRGLPFSVDFSTALDLTMREGLARSFWPARSHLMDDLSHSARFYIDGAHTLRSLEVCADWYKTTVPQGTKRALIFTIHHERNVASMLGPLLQLHFDRVYFCKTSAARPSLAKMHTFSEALEAAGLGQIVTTYTTEQLTELDAVVDGPLQWQYTLAKLWRAMKTHTTPSSTSSSSSADSMTVDVLPSVVECIADLRAQQETKKEGEETWNVLVTGSLYLAGETLSFLGWQE